MRKRREGPCGFSLLEVAVVLTVMLAMASVLLWAWTAWQEGALREETRQNLAALASDLEAYRAEFGDYPWLKPGEDGRIALQAALVSGEPPLRGWEWNGTAWVETGAVPPTRPQPDIPALRKLRDGWGSFFFYTYKRLELDPADNPWTSPGFILTSAGPDGRIGILPGQDGELPLEAAENPANQDNLVWPP